MEAQVEPREAKKRPTPPEAEEHPFGAPPKDLPAHDPAPPARVTDTVGVRLDILDLGKKSDRARFLEVTEPLYRGDPYYIEPLRMERMHLLDLPHNPAMKDIEAHVIIATKDGRDVGRLTAHLDHAYDRYHGTKSGWFGFFECINDKKVAHAMFAQGMRWLRQKGAVDCIGPMNFNTNQQCGLLVENFDRPPMVEMTYNPRYYEPLITSYGFKKAKDLFVYWIDVHAPLENPKIARVAKIAEKIKQREGVSIRHGDKRRWKEEVELLFSIYNRAWTKNWGYVPVNKAEFEQLANSVKPILREEVVLIVEVRGDPVGFAMTLPDVNEIMPRNGKLLPLGWAKMLTGMRKIRTGKIKHGRLMVLGMAPEYRKRGLESLLFLETALRCNQIGLHSGEVGWTLEDNHLINRAVESMDGKLDRRYRLFGLTL
ncbi:MAG: N-acetyltransferase [Deltaproteobacteria bacterium]|nr:N-acetyltransferase [Deltaproteobacteria bacterium]